MLHHIHDTPTITKPETYSTYHAKHNTKHTHAAILIRQLLMREQLTGNNTDNNKQQSHVICQWDQCRIRQQIRQLLMREHLTGNNTDNNKQQSHVICQWDQCRIPSMLTTLESPICCRLSPRQGAPVPSLLALSAQKKYIIMHTHPLIYIY